MDEPIDRLIIAGDLWDLWLISPKKARCDFKRVINVFEVLACTGTYMSYILGNHDEDYLKDPIIPLRTLPVIDRAPIALPDGQRLAVIHGHRFDYLYARHYVLYRLGFYLKLFRKWACPSWWRDRHSTASARWLLGAMHQVARETYHDMGYDGVIMGHTHQPADTPPGAQFAFYNAGDWIDHTSYVEIKNGGMPVLKSFDG